MSLFFYFQEYFKPLWQNKCWKPKIKINIFDTFRTKEITATDDKYWMILETFSQINWKRGPMFLLNQVWLYDIQQKSFPIEILFRALSRGVKSWTARKFEILNFVFLSVSSLKLQSKVSFGLPWLMKGYLFSYAKD